MKKKYVSCTDEIGEYCRKHGVVHKTPHCVVCKKKLGWFEAKTCMVCGIKEKSKDMIEFDKQKARDDFDLPAVTPITQQESPSETLE